MISFHNMIFIVIKLVNIHSPKLLAKTDYTLYLYSMIAMVNDVLILVISLILYVQPCY